MSQEFIEFSGFRIINQVGKNCFYVSKRDKFYYIKSYPLDKNSYDFIKNLNAIIFEFSSRLEIHEIVPINVYESEEIVIHIFNDLIPDKNQSNLDILSIKFNFKLGNFLWQMHEVGKDLPNQDTYYQHHLRTLDKLDKQISQIKSEISNLEDQITRNELTDRINLQLEIAVNMASELNRKKYNNSKIVLHGDFLPKNILYNKVYDKFYPIDWDCVAYGPKFHEIIRYFEKSLLLDNEAVINSFLEGYFESKNSFIEYESARDAIDRYLLNKLLNIYEYPNLTDSNVHNWIQVNENVQSLLVKFKNFNKLIQKFYSKRFV